MKAGRDNILVAGDYIVMSENRRKAIDSQDQRETELESLRRQLVNANENLRLIEERRTEFVLEVDVPLQIIREERRLRNHIAELEGSIANYASQRETEAKKLFQERVLDAAIAKQVPVGKPTDLVALVRRTNSKGLRAILEIDTSYEMTKDEVISKPFYTEFPIQSNGIIDDARLTLKVDSPDFDPVSQYKTILVPPEGDSETCTFLLTPKRIGKLQLNLEVYAGDLYLTSRILQTNSEVSDRDFITTSKVLVTIPLTVWIFALPETVRSNTFSPDIHGSGNVAAGKGGVAVIGDVHGLIITGDHNIVVTGDDIVGDKVTHEEKIETGGGANIGGNIALSGNSELVGRDKHTAFDQRGQQVGHQVNVAGDNIVYEAPVVGVDMLHQLPAPPADFTGRETELVELLAKFDQGVTISGLQGQGGIGKTALALKLAAQLIERYPDAQIFLDLKGVSSSPLTAGEIMAHVVRSFQPTAKLPDTEDELKAAYRTALFNKRALLLLDNARDAEQIKALLPAPAGCGVIVTSRLQFHVPGLFAQNLEVLPVQDACALLLKIVPRIGIEAEHIARLCGYLPLTLTMAGGTLAERIDLSPASYARRLEDEQARLDMVAASFTLSYELLSEELRTTWQTLAVFPSTFEVQGAAAVCGLEREVAEMRLSDLVRYCLVEWEATAERYHLHDLARLFADSKLGDDDRKAMQQRHAEHYKNVLSIADAFFLEGGEMTTSGLALFDAEWENSLTGQAWAAKYAISDDEVARLCSAYGSVGINCLSLRIDEHVWIRWLKDALVAARELKNRTEESIHLGGLGNAYAALDEMRRAIEFYEQALVIEREIGNQRGEGVDLGNLGSAYYKLGEVQRAIEFYGQALVIAREISDRRSEGAHLGNLGTSYADLGEMQRAIKYCEEALGIARELGDRRNESNWLGNLGNVYLDLGGVQKAIERYEEALGVAHEIGDRRNESNWLGNLGNAYRCLGEVRQAIECYEEALRVAREIGDRRSEGNHIGNLGIVYADLGEVRQAIECYEEALRVAREIDDRHGEGTRLGNLGRVHADLNEVRRAIEYYEQALIVVREISDRRGEGTHLYNMSLAYNRLGERAKAISLAEDALRIFESIENPDAQWVRQKLAEWRATSGEKQGKKKWQFWRR